VSLTGDSANLRPIRILPDTGASQTLLLDGVLPLSEKTSTGASVLIQGVELGFIGVPLHVVYLKSDLVSGSVTVGVRPTVPVEGVSLLLGNDLAGDKVVANPIVSNELCVQEDSQEQEDPDVFLSCAVTRAMSKISEEISNQTTKENELVDLERHSPIIEDLLPSSLTDKQVVEDPLSRKKYSRNNQNTLTL